MKGLQLKSWNNLKENVDKGQILLLTVYGVQGPEPVFVYLYCSHTHICVGNAGFYSSNKINFLFDITDNVKNANIKSDEIVLLDVLTEHGENVKFERSEIKIINDNNL